MNPFFSCIEAALQDYASIYTPKDSEPKAVIHQWVHAIACSFYRVQRTPFFTQDVGHLKNKFSLSVCQPIPMYQEVRICKNCPLELCLIAKPVPFFLLLRELEDKAINWGNSQLQNAGSIGKNLLTH